MIIYGAGLAGLITAHVLKHHNPIIHEAQSSLPNNHEALLRFRSDAVSRACRIPFREVEVTKCIHYNGELFHNPTGKLNNLYSYKVTGEYHSRSIGNLEPCKRYIAPPDLIQKLSRGLLIEYNSRLSSLQWPERDMDATPVISTVPMPVMMQLANWELPPVFKFKTIWSAWIEVTNPVVDLHQTIYYPEPNIPYYRASVTGNRIILEFSEQPEDVEIHFDDVLGNFGIVHRPALKDISIKEQRYGKLLPIDDSIRRKFIIAMTDEYRIYSIGRFATWRQILMDDVVADAAIIDRWLTDRDIYTGRIGRAK